MSLYDPTETAVAGPILTSYPFIEFTVEITQAGVVIWVLDESYNMTDEVTVHVVAAVVNPRLKVLD